MKRKGLILFLAAMLVLPIFAMSMTACNKGVKTEMTDEEKARLEAERRAAELARLGGAERDTFLNEHVYFDYNRYNIRPDMQPILQYKADYMKKYAKVLVEVQGHCDERGSEAYNMALGDRRANAAANHLESLGIAANRVTTVSYGEERPLDPGHNEAAWAKNRRAQFVITGQ